MARAVYDFQSLNKKTAIVKRREAMSKEIIQFDQAMFESKLDAMVREKVERIVNAMPDASGERDRQRREIRAFRLMVADRWGGNQLRLFLGACGCLVEKRG